MTNTNFHGLTPLATVGRSPASSDASLISFSLAALPEVQRALGSRLNYRQITRLPGSIQSLGVVDHDGRSYIVARGWVADDGPSPETDQARSALGLDAALVALNDECDDDEDRSVHDRFTDVLAECGLWLDVETGAWSLPIDPSAESPPVPQPWDLNAGTDQRDAGQQQPHVELRQFGPDGEPFDRYASDSDHDWLLNPDASLQVRWRIDGAPGSVWRTGPRTLAGQRSLFPASDEEYRIERIHTTPAETTYAAVRAPIVTEALVGDVRGGQPFAVSVQRRDFDHPVTGFWTLDGADYFVHVRADEYCRRGVDQMCDQIQVVDVYAMDGTPVVAGLYSGPVVAWAGRPVAVEIEDDDWTTVSLADVLTSVELASAIPPAQSQGDLDGMADSLRIFVLDGAIWMGVADWGSIGAVQILPGDARWEHVDDGLRRVWGQCGPVAEVLQVGDEAVYVMGTDDGGIYGFRLEDGSPLFGPDAAPIGADA